MLHKSDIILSPSNLNKYSFNPREPMAVIALRDNHSSTINPLDTGGLLAPLAIAFVQGYGGFPLFGYLVYHGVLPLPLHL